MSSESSPPKLTNHRARAPGKLILSGEHAVVYGAPALALAVQQYTTVSFTQVLRTNGLRTAFDNVSHGQFYPLELLRAFKQGLDKRFEAFKSGDITVREILQRPDDLAVYSMAVLLNYMPMPGLTATHHLPEPGVLSSQSNIPTGAGMGSSAAVIAATFVLYENLLGHVQSAEQRFERVRFCERLQHGQGSAIDAACVVYGGVNRVVDGKLERDQNADNIQLLDDGWYWVYHGTPEAMTGECVSQVRQQHSADQALWDAFAACTNQLQNDISHASSPVTTLRENHQLLTRIGVVPASAQSLIADIEQAGGAAKVSGAGSVRGDSAGIILVYLPDASRMQALMEQYQLEQWQALKPCEDGAHLLPASAQSAPVDVLPLTH